MSAVKLLYAFRRQGNQHDLNATQNANLTNNQLRNDKWKAKDSKNPHEITLEFLYKEKKDKILCKFDWSINKKKRVKTNTTVYNLFIYIFSVAYVKYIYSWILKIRFQKAAMRLIIYREMCRPSIRFGATIEYLGNCIRSQTSSTNTSPIFQDFRTHTFIGLCICVCWLCWLLVCMVWWILLIRLSW